MPSLDELEAVIARGLGAFFEVGDALRQISGARLYKDTHDTFESYCIERWQLSRPRAYELMAAADVVASLSAIADTPMPRNEAQARQLAPMRDKPEQMAEAMQRASVDAPATAKKIAAVVEEMLDEAAEKAETVREDKAAIADLNATAEAAGIDGDEKRQTARTTLGRVAKDLTALGTPHQFLVSQTGHLMPRHKTSARAAHQWLSDLLEEWGEA